MQNRGILTVCVCVRVRAGKEYIPVVLIESCLADWGRRSAWLTHSFIHTHTYLHRPIQTDTHTHTRCWILHTFIHTLSTTHTHYPTLEERYYWIETVGHPLSHRPVWCSDKLSLPLSVIICVCGLNRTHTGNKIFCLSTWNQNRWREI